MTKQLTRAKGATWNLPVREDVRLPTVNDVPMPMRLAFTHLATQYYRVVATGFHPSLLGTGEELEVELYLKEDTLNPTRQTIVKRNGHFYRKDRRSGLWPVYKTVKPAEPEQATRRRSELSRRQAAAARARDTMVREDPWDDNVHRLFVERAEIEDEIKAANDAFLQDPSVVNMIKLQEVRRRLEPIEQRIVASALAEQARKDLSAVA